MKEYSDVIVVGGGPIGSFTALKLAQSGIDVTVHEEHEQIGIPSHCAGHLSIKSLERLHMYPLPSRIVENTYVGADFYSSAGRRLPVRLASPVTCAINRSLFDQYIANAAQEAGARYRMNSRVERLFMEEGNVRGVKVKQNGNNLIEKGKVVVDAEGVAARLLRDTNLAGPRREMLVNGIEAEVQNVRDAQFDTVDVYFGSTYAPGFFGWLMPKKDGTAKVGLAARAQDPKRLLDKLMTKHPIASLKLSNSKVSHTMIHALSLGGEIQKTYSSGLLVVGDAASQVKPTTGGGVVFGMTCAAIAAKVAHDAIQKDDVSSKFLRAYQHRCKDAVGIDLTIMGKIRKALNMMSDKKMDNFIASCAKSGLEETLKKIDDIDLQGRSLFHIIFNPRILTTIGYFSLSCFLGNA